jgi:hypothetical protein
MEKDAGLGLCTRYSTMKNKKVRVRVKEFTEETMPEFWVIDMLDMCGKEYNAFKYYKGEEYKSKFIGYEICGYNFMPEEVEVIEEETDKPKRESILKEAERIVNGERANDYGSAEESFNKIASLTNLLLNENEIIAMTDGYITNTVACKVLIAVKLVRESNKHKRDNLVDLCGYAELLDRLEEI